MSRKPSRLPTRSNSILRGRPPADATAPDDQAVQDVYNQVESTGSLELAAKKLQQLAFAKGGSEVGTPRRSLSRNSRTGSTVTSHRGSRAGSPDRTSGISALSPMTVAFPPAAKQAPSRPIWADDPEEAEYMAQTQGAGTYDDSALSDDDYDDEEVMGEEDEQQQQEIVHMQEVVEGLWVGDLVAAMDQDGLEERGIVSFVYQISVHSRHDSY